jgi:putative ABC transport system permease protein
LFGLTNFIAEKRTKEIGIRKVIGASVTGIVALLSKGLIKLVILAILIATPLAWWAMNSWLNDFAYHTDIGWWVFVIAGLASLLIALVTISFQAVKAALANPIKSLKTE